MMPIRAQPQERLFGPQDQTTVLRRNNRLQEPLPTKLPPSTVGTLPCQPSVPVHYGQRNNRRLPLLAGISMYRSWQLRFLQLRLTVPSPAGGVGLHVPVLVVLAPGLTQCGFRV